MHARIAKLLRFAVVGITNGLIYAVATAIYISLLTIDDKVASVLGFCSAVPFAFIAHRTYTFSSAGPIITELRRFVLTQVTSLLVSVLAMGLAVDYLGLHYAAGIIAGVILVPIVTFVVFDNWVFRNQISSNTNNQ